MTETPANEDERACSDCGKVDWCYNMAGLMLCPDCYDEREYAGMNVDDDLGSSS